MTPLARAYSGHWLVVDDQEICRRAASDLLTNLGATCDVASDGLEALAALESGPYVGLLIDGSMPKMSGYEAVAHVRQKETELGLPALLIIMVTGEPVAASKKCEQLVDLIVEKPLRRGPNSLSLAIAEVCLKRAVDEKRFTAARSRRSRLSARLGSAVGCLARALGRSDGPSPVASSTTRRFGPADTVVSPMTALFQGSVPLNEATTYVSTVAAAFSEFVPSERLEIERLGVSLSFIEALGKYLGMSSAHFFEVLGMPARLTTTLVRGAPAFAAITLIQLLGVAMQIAANSSPAKSSDFNIGAWLGHWIETPQRQIGNMRPAVLAALPTGLPVLLKLLDNAGGMSFQSDLNHDNFD